MVGRIEEIKTLDEIMSRKEGQLVAVYGRRRIGKTYLIRNYFKDKFTFYHTGEANVGFRDYPHGSLAGQIHEFHEFHAPHCKLIKLIIDMTEGAIVQ